MRLADSKTGARVVPCRRRRRGCWRASHGFNPWVFPRRKKGDAQHQRLLGPRGVRQAEGTGAPMIGIKGLPGADTGRGEVEAGYHRAARAGVGGQARHKAAW